MCIRDRGASDLKDGTASLVAGIGTLYDGATQLDSGAGQLKDGTTSLVAGVGTLHSGALQLHDGAGDLKDGADKLNDGVATLIDGVKQLRDGAKAVSYTHLDVYKRQDKYRCNDNRTCCGLLRSHR